MHLFFFSRIWSQLKSNSTMSSFQFEGIGLGLFNLEFEFVWYSILSYLVIGLFSSLSCTQTIGNKESLYFVFIKRQKAMVTKKKMHSSSLVNFTFLLNVGSRVPSRFLGFPLVHRSPLLVKVSFDLSSLLQAGIVEMITAVAPVIVNGDGNTSMMQ